MDTTTRTRILSYLNRYLFDQVWNEPRSEYRVNVRPQVINAIPKSGRLHFISASIPLPTTDSYYVYAVPKCCLEIDFSMPSWISLDTYMINNPNVDIRVHGTSGQYLVRNKIYVIDHPDTDMFIVAVEKKMAIKVLGTAYDKKEIFVAIYFDSDKPNDVIRQYKYISTIDDKISVYSQKDNFDTIFVNGREVVLQSSTDINIGDYVEMIRDENIIATFDIDLTDKEQCRIFASDLSSNFKYIVHIPKALNPDNKVITHNLCDVYVRPKGITGAHMKGLFLHRAYEDRGITQITHNDFAIPEPIITAYCNQLGSNEVSLHVVCRYHNRDQYLVREANYINMLYLLTDKEILDFMEEIGPVNMEFWSAKHLEKSQYVNMLFSVPEFANLNNASDFISALGFYNSIGILCRRVHNFTVNDSVKRNFLVDIPESIIGNMMHLNVCINGLKINDDLTRVATYDSSVGVIIDEAVPYANNDKVTTELFEVPKFYSQTVHVTEVNNKFPIIGNIKLFRKVLTTVDNYNKNFLSKDYGCEYSYYPVTISNIATISIEDNVQYITFTSDAYDNDYLITSERLFSRVTNNTFNIVDLNIATIQTDMMTVPSIDMISGEIVNIPLIDFDTTSIVYLNGHELVKDVDYSFIKQKSYGGGNVYSAIYIQNVSYLQPTGNNIEVYITTDKEVGRDYGFVSQTKLPSLTSILYWLEGLSRIVADGSSVRSMTWNAGYLQLSDNPRNGALYQVRATCPLTIKEFVDEYAENLDDERIPRIVEFFRSMTTPLPEIELIERSHMIYSILVNEVLKEAIAGRIVLAFDADASRMLLQVPDFLSLNDIDVIHNNINKLNFKYVDFYPSYRLNESFDIEIYRNTLQLAKAVLPNDTIKDGDTING